MRHDVSHKFSLRNAEVHSALVKQMQAEETAIVAEKTAKLRALRLAKEEAETKAALQCAVAV